MCCRVYAPGLRAIDDFLALASTSHDLLVVSDGNSCKDFALGGMRGLGCPEGRLPAVSLRIVEMQLSCIPETGIRGPLRHV